MNIDELLQSERRRGGFSEEERAAMWQGIERTVAGVGTAAAAATATAPAPAAAKAAAAKMAGWKLGTMLAVAAIGGAAIGAAAHARWGAPKIVEVVAPAPNPSAPPPATTLAPAPVETRPEIPTVARAPSATPTPREIVRVAPAPSAAPPKDPSLARERTLLDMARTALSRGDTAAALVSLDAHAREFPSSQFGPEREVLAIQALASANRAAEARQRAAAFRASYPKSALLPIVDEATKPSEGRE